MRKKHNSLLFLQELNLLPMRLDHLQVTSPAAGGRLSTVGEPQTLQLYHMGLDSPQSSCVI